MLLQINFYIKYFDKKKKKKLVIFSFIVGLTNESVVIFINLYLIYRKIILNDKNIKFLNMVSLWTGTVIQIFSFGNFNRKIHPDTLNITYSLVQKIILFFNS